MFRWKRLAAVLVACLATINSVACKKASSFPPIKTLDSDSEEQSKPLSTKPVSEEKEEGDWPLYLKEDGFAISLPPDWRQIDMDPAKFDASFREAAKDNPQLNNLMASLRQKIASGTEFYGLDAKTGSDTNVNVLHTHNPREYTLDEMVAIYLRDLEMSKVIIKPVVHERTRIAAGEAERFRYTMMQKDPYGRIQKSECTQFCYPKGRECFMVTLITPTERYWRYEPTLNRIGQSFRLTQ